MAEAPARLTLEQQQQMDDSIGRFLRGDDNQMDIVFQLLDADGNGKIDMDEFKTRFFKTNEKPGEEQLLKIFDHIDANNDGIIDKQELISELRNWRDN